METIPVHLFKNSFGPFLALLNEHEVKYHMRAVRSGIPMASPDTLEIIKVLGSATFWPALATVVVAFINRKKDRKVIITTKENTVVHVEGMSTSEIERILQQARNITAIDTSKNEENPE